MGVFDVDKYYEHESKLIILKTLGRFDTSEIYPNGGLIGELFAVNGRYEIQIIDENKYDDFTLLDDDSSVAIFINEHATECKNAEAIFLEENKYYKQTDGYVIHTLKIVKTSLYGECTIAEDNMGNILPIVKIDDYKWTEVSKEEFEKSGIWL